MRQRHCAAAGGGINPALPLPMCGRYALRTLDLSSAALDALAEAGFEEFTDHPRYNIAPSQKIPVVRFNKDGRRAVGLVRWGLIPHWARELPKFQPINARAESVATSGMFKQAFGRRRCIVP